MVYIPFEWSDKKDISYSENIKLDFIDRNYPEAAFLL